jgi:uracil-DNA glycosylase
MSQYSPNFFKLCEEWSNFMFSDEVVEILNEITSVLDKTQEEIYPDSTNIFNCFYTTPFNSVKVIVVGQDPYHTPNMATGLCFDVENGSRFPPSLQNIYKELELEGYYPTRDGSLKHWATQGVLLLNTALTVKKGEPESHVELWKDFFQKVLEKLFTKDFAVWVILGQKARVLIDKIPQNHKILEATHPSPFSAYKASSTQQAFIGSNIFKKVNDILQSKDIEKISY